MIQGLFTHFNPSSLQAFSMERQAPVNTDIILRDGELFASVDHLRQIFASSSGTYSPFVRIHDDQTFFSVIHINDALASFTTDRFEIVVKPDEAGHEDLALRLVDRRGEEVPTKAALRLNIWALHSSASSEDGRQPGDNGLESFCEGDYDVSGRHDTPIDSGRLDKAAGQLGQLREGSPPHYAQNVNKEIDGSDGSSGLFVSSPALSEDLTPWNMPDESHKSENEVDSAQIVVTHHPPVHYDETIVQKLRGLQLTDLDALNRLLENRSPSAINPIPNTRNQYAHLCTLADGTIYLIKMFQGLHCRSETLDFVNLNDPALLHQSLTGYQKNELSIILRDLLQTDFAQILWSSAHLVPPKHREHYRRIIPQPSAIQRNLFYHYETMSDFHHEIALLAQNAERFHGRDHAVTAAAARTAREIALRMDAAAAIGIADTTTTHAALFHGVVRELSLAEGTTMARSEGSPPPLARAPRFVLPLGRLHTSHQHLTEPPVASSAAILLMDVTTPRKALWLYEDGPESSCLVKLADDIAQWKLRDDGLMQRDQPGFLSRADLAESYPESRVDLSPAAVRFQRAPKAQLAQAVEKGWGWEALPAAQVARPRKRPAAAAEEGGMAMATPKKKKKKKRGFMRNSDEEEAWVPATERGKSNKTTTTPKGSRRRAKAPRTV